MLWHEKQRVQPQVWALQRALQGQVLSCQLVSLWAVAPVAALHVESLDALLQLGPWLCTIGCHIRPFVKSEYLSTNPFALKLRLSWVAQVFQNLT